MHGSSAAYLFHARPTHPATLQRALQTEHSTGILDDDADFDSPAAREREYDEMLAHVGIVADVPARPERSTAAATNTTVEEARARERAPMPKDK